LSEARSIIVIGAGIIGSACAWQFARDGAKVTLVERGEAAGGIATAASFSWINATFGNPRPYFDLRMQAIAGWRRLAALFPDAGIRFAGGLFYELEGTALDEFVEEHSGWGYRLKIVRRQDIAALEPLLADPPERAALASDEAFVEAAEFARKLAASSGIRFVAGAGDVSIAVSGGRVTGVDISGARLEADIVLVAAGEGTPEILRRAGIAFGMHCPAGLLVTTTPFRGSLRHLLIGPRVHVRQLPDGRLLAGSDFLGSHDAERPERTAAGILAELRAMFGDPGLALDHYTIGRRPTPKDGFPALGPVPGIDGLHVAVTHSGVTLAPAIAEMLSAEILGGRPDPLMAPFRFGRLLDQARAPTP
jgi:glycine/D-amino acid oxidase-like deaminating enzyme